MTLPTVPLIINGKEEYDPSSSFDVISPYTNEPCWSAAAASSQDALRAVEAAEAAFPAWSTTKPAIRRDILLKAANLLEERLEESAGFMRSEMGADVGASQGFVVPLGIRMMRDLAGRISSVCGSVPVVETEGQSAMICKEPMGVILGLVPWFVITLVNGFIFIITIANLNAKGTLPTSLASAPPPARSLLATPPSSNPPNSPPAATGLSPAPSTMPVCLRAVLI